MSIDKAGNKPFIPVEDTTDTTAKPKNTESSTKVPAGALSPDPGSPPPAEGSGLTATSKFPGMPEPVVINFGGGRTYNIYPNSPLSQLFTHAVIHNKAAMAEIKEGVEQISSDELAPVMLPIVTAQEAMASLKTGTLTGSDAIANLKKDFEEQPGLAALTPTLAAAEQQIAKVDTAVNSGSLHPLVGAAQIDTIVDQAQDNISVIRDTQFAKNVLTFFHNDEINTPPEVKEQFVNTMSHYANANARVHTPVVEDGDKSIAKDKLSLVEQQTKLQQELEAIRESGPFNMATFVASFTKALNDIRTLSNKIKIAERNATLTLQLASAEDTRQAGRERMKAALISGIMGICAGAISIVGSVMAFKSASAAKDKSLEDTLAKGLEDGVDTKAEDFVNNMNKAAISTFDSTLNTVTQITNGISQSVKASGDMGAGIKQMDIAGVEAEGKTNDAYAQGAASREDAAKKMADDMLQLMRDIISNQQKLNDTQNSNVSSIIRNMA